MSTIVVWVSISLPSITLVDSLKSTDFSHKGRLLATPLTAPLISSPIELRTIPFFACFLKCGVL